MNNIVQVLAAILNSLWQGAIVAALVWLALRFSPRINAATRYAIWWAAMAVVLILPAAPRLLSLLHAGPQSAPARAGQLANLRPAVNRPAELQPTIVTLPEDRSARWPLWIVALWAAIFAFRAGQIARSYFYLRGVQRRAEVSSQPLPSIRRPLRLLLSNEIASPMAVGFLKPAVIVPDSLPDELEKPELEHVLLHETAHIARRDDWTNLLVRLLAAALGLHPVAMWILHQIEREREIACDDWVVAHTGAARPYAASLARMFELRWSRRRDLLASGIFGGGVRVGDRIEMLLKRGREFSPRASFKRVTASAIMLLTLAVASPLAPRWIAFAQTPSFEVASIKPADPNQNQFRIGSMPGRAFHRLRRDSEDADRNHL